MAMIIVGTIYMNHLQASGWSLSICHTGTQKTPAAFPVSLPHVAVFRNSQVRSMKPEQGLALRAVKENIVSWGP